MRLTILFILLTTFSVMAQERPNVFFAGNAAGYYGQGIDFLHQKSGKLHAVSPESMTGLEVGIEGSLIKSNCYPFAAFSYRKTHSETTIEGIDPSRYRYNRIVSYLGFTGGIGNIWFQKGRCSMETTLASGLLMQGHICNQGYSFNEQHDWLLREARSNVEAYAIPADITHGIRLVFGPIGLQTGIRAGTHFYLPGSVEKGNNLIGGFYAKLHLDI